MVEEELKRHASRRDAEREPRSKGESQRRGCCWRSSLHTVFVVQLSGEPSFFNAWAAGGGPPSPPVRAACFRLAERRVRRLASAMAPVTLGWGSPGGSGVLTGWMALRWEGIVKFDGRSRRDPGLCAGGVG